MNGQHPHNIVDAIRNGEIVIPEEWIKILFHCFLFTFTDNINCFVARNVLLRKALRAYFHKSIYWYIAKLKLQSIIPT